MSSNVHSPGTTSGADAREREAIKAVPVPALGTVGLGRRRASRSWSRCSTRSPPTTTSSGRRSRSTSSRSRCMARPLGDHPADRALDGDRHRARHRARRHAAVAEPGDSGPSRWFYIWFFRGTPVLVQLFVWFNLALVFHADQPRSGLARPTRSGFMTPFVAALLAPGAERGRVHGRDRAAPASSSVDEGQTEASARARHDPRPDHAPHRAARRPCA